MSNPTLDLTRALIERPSVTPDDQGCQELMIARLEAIGFQVKRLRFGEVDNFWAWRGKGKPLVCFAGHTDVVPTGPVQNWTSDPFTPEIRGGHLYGRGAADMKASLAAFITSIESFVAEHDNHAGTIALLITADEEGPSIDGTVKVVSWLEKNDIKIDYCLVGEPSSEKEFGDVIKNGRRGSLNGKLVITGKQGHIAYPHLAENPIHMALPALSELTNIVWDTGNEYFPSTSFQISNIESGTGAENVIPGTIEIDFNFRFSTAVTDSELRQKVEAVLAKNKLNYRLDWRLSGQPFLTPEGALVDAVRGAIKTVLKRETRLSTGGGTSDGRFIAPTGAQVVEIGPLNTTIHQIDECISTDTPKILSELYRHTLINLLV